MGITGYLVSIPVFVDVAYIVLQPVTEALSLRSKKTILVIGLALTAGLTVSHTLIPPTPGPLAVASL
jgi:GntP family gluconate:H+ symporter